MRKSRSRLREAAIQDLQRRIQSAKLYYATWEALMAKRISEGSEAARLEYETHRLPDGETPELRDLRARLRVLASVADPMPAEEELRRRRELRLLREETKALRRARDLARDTRRRNALLAKALGLEEADRLAEEASVLANRLLVRFEVSRLLPRFEAMLPPIEPRPTETPSDTHDRVEAREMLLRAIVMSSRPKELPAIVQHVALGETLDEVGLENGVTRERIRQHGGAALRKLRHPSRSHRLRVFGEDGPLQTGPVCLENEVPRGFHLWEPVWEEVAWSLPSAEEVLEDQVALARKRKRRVGLPLRLRRRQVERFWEEDPDA